MALVVCTQLEASDSRRQDARRMSVMLNQGSAPGLCPSSLFIAILVLAVPPISLGQPSQMVVRHLQLGDDGIDVILRTFGTPTYLFCNLHNDETTSVTAATEVLQDRSGRLTELRHDGERNIEFDLRSRHYRFDPNRIFTPLGVRKTLEDLSTVTPEAERTVIHFGKELLRIYEIERFLGVIALHNNTEGHYAVTDYIKPHGRFAADASDVHYDGTTDADDFFFVTDRSLFDALSQRGFNAVLQNNASVTDDGSLSVYCGRLGIRYVNVEAQHGHQEQQVTMLKTLLEILDQQHPTDTAASLDLVNLLEIDPTFVIDCRYATKNNITGEVLYPKQTLYLERSAAERLAHVQANLRQQGLGLKIFDAYRPLSVQKKLWQAKPDPRYVADPAKGSRHNRGSAVDVTLVDRAGQELPMPTEFDEFSEKAHSTYRDLPAAILTNREQLHAAMKAEGFLPLETEWWHFDAPGWDRFPVSDINPYE